MECVMNREDKLDQPPTHAKAHITQGNGVYNRNFPLYRVNDGHFTSFRAFTFVVVQKREDYDPNRRRKTPPYNYWERILVATQMPFRHQKNTRWWPRFKW